MSKYSLIRVVSFVMSSIVSMTLLFMFPKVVMTLFVVGVSLMLYTLPKLHS